MMISQTPEFRVNGEALLALTLLLCLPALSPRWWGNLQEWWDGGLLALQTWQGCDAVVGK